MSYGDVLVQVVEKQTQRDVFLDNKSRFDSWSSPPRSQNEVQNV